ncbi:MAG: ABC transporter permease [Chloroflexaceae bacterium]|nr:ABC transporter permease [Chloroflexaceae bacterium]
MKYRQFLPTRREAFVAGRWLLVLVGALAFTHLVLLLSGTSPSAAYRLVLFDAFSSPSKRADMVMLASPLLLCSAGLTLTFAIGLYNLGIEGQVAIGAVAAMIPLRLLPDVPPLLLWGLAFSAGALGGAGWGLVIALLRLYGRVSEIFAGLGMNFLATGVALYLVLGPWKRPGIASMSGTERLPNAIWLPTLEGLRVAPAAPVLALLALALVWFALARTHWGLSVRAVGANPAASRRLGVPSSRRLVETLAVCGALAGIAGTLQVLAVFHALIPNISSGIGLMGLLVVLLAQANPAWVLPVVLLFATFTIGSVGLPLQLQIDSSISGVLQGALVLGALVAQGVRKGGRRSE